MLYAKPPSRRCIKKYRPLSGHTTAGKIIRKTLLMIESQYKIHANHSDLIAASGLSRMARMEGKRPESIPMPTANTTDSRDSHSGI